MPNPDYTPHGPLPQPVVHKSEFAFAVAHLDHGHIFMQTQGLLAAGARLKWVFDLDPKRVESFLQRFADSGARPATTIAQILEDPEIKLVAAAAIPCDRGPLGLRVMEAGKDYFTDKCPFTSLEQLAEARAKVAQTGRKYAVFYSERLCVESAIHADRLIRSGALGKLIHLSITGPHRHGSGRPDWFYEKKRYGGILTDICSHQVDQFLQFAEADGGEVCYARVENFAHPEKPEFEDFGEAIFKLSNRVSCHSRVDWFTPNGLSTWGDGRVVAVGEKGFLEIRKNCDLGRDDSGEVIYLVDDGGEHVIPCAGKVGFPFFGELILDCLNRTENAMTQEHAFRAAELSLQAQAVADAARKI
jgi:predicted dehydrogenase